MGRFFTNKAWRNKPSTATPINAAALIDLEERVTDYADAVAASGVLLGFESITTAPPTVSGNVPVLVAGLSVEVEVETRPLLVVAHTYALYNTSTGDAMFSIHEDGIAVGDQITMGQSLALGANKGNGQTPATIVFPSAGTHTYNACLRVPSGAGNAGIGAILQAPAWIAVIEV